MRANRPSQLEGEEAAADLPKPDVGATEDYIAMVDQLRTIVMTRPDDQQGWELLARHEASLANYAEAARALFDRPGRRGGDRRDGCGGALDEDREERRRRRKEERRAERRARRGE